MQKTKKAKERLARYEAYQKTMEESGVSQLSLTDADARLIKSKNGFACGDCSKTKQSFLEVENENSQN